MVVEAALFSDGDASCLHLVDHKLCGVSVFRKHEWFLRGNIFLAASCTNTNETKQSPASSFSLVLLLILFKPIPVLLISWFWGQLGCPLLCLVYNNNASRNKHT